MVAGVRLASDSAVHAGSLKTVGGRWALQKMVDPQTRVSLPSIPQVMPEGVHRRGWLKSADCVHPSLFRQLGKGSPTCRLNQRVFVPRLGGVDVLVCRNDIVVACEHDGHPRGQKLSGMCRQSAKPGELVIEFGTGLRVAIGCVQRRNNDPIHRRAEGIPAQGRLIRRPPNHCS
jgi:hypothetical protein